MAQEVFVAMFRGLEGAEAARRSLERSGIAVGDIDMRSRELTGFGAQGISPAPHGFWEWLLEREPRYRRHMEQTDGALLAVRADGQDYDRIATLLLHHEPVAPHERGLDKTSQSPRVARFVIDSDDRVPLHEETVTGGIKS